MTVLCAFATLLDQIPLVEVIPLEIFAEDYPYLAFQTLTESTEAAFNNLRHRLEVRLPVLS